jgi:hypothetical protein
MIIYLHGGYWRPEIDRKHARNFCWSISKLNFKVALV